MPNNNSENVYVAKPLATGCVFVAPKGTAVPTDATTALNAAFVNVGYISEDGITNAIETDSEEVKAFGCDIVASPQTSRSETFQYTMIETNETSLKHVFGSNNVTVSGTNITILHNGDEKDETPVVIETLLGKNKIKRQVIPRGKLKEIGEIVYKDDEPVGYEATIQALLDSAGNTAYEYIAAYTPTFAVSPSTMTVTKGSSATATLFNATGTVTASCTGTGLTATISGNTVTVAAASTSTNGTVTLTDSNSHTCTITVTVQAAG